MECGTRFLLGGGSFRPVFFNRKRWPVMTETRIAELKAEALSALLTDRVSWAVGIMELIDEVNRLREHAAIPHNAICFFRDGAKWCCVNGDFVNLQESDAGFGFNFPEALGDLQESIEKRKGPRAEVTEVVESR